MAFTKLLASLLLGGVAAATPGPDTMFERGRVTVTIDGESRGFPYRLLRAEGATAENPLPLVVFLHGAGERGDDNTAQLRHFPGRTLASVILRSSSRCSARGTRRGAASIGATMAAGMSVPRKSPPRWSRSRNSSANSPPIPRLTRHGST